MSCYVALGWQAGVLLAALLTPFLLQHIGWRGMFVVGVLPALLAWAMRNRLHEPEAFVQRAAQPKANAFRLLVADGRTTRTSVGIVILCSVQNFGYYGIMIWLPTFLSKQMGFADEVGAVDGGDGRRDDDRRLRSGSWPTASGASRRSCCTSSARS